jgi:hypothetical protein
MHTPLTYELGKLELVIKSLQVRKEDRGQTILFEFGKDLQDTLRNEVNTIKKNFVHEVFNFDDELHLQRYIQFHQQELVRILDSLQHPDRVREDLATSEDTIYGIRMIEDLLNFIERHFTRYFNQDTKAPESYIALAGSDLLNVIPYYQEALQNQNIESGLIALVLAPLRKFIEHTSTGKLTYRDIMYVREVGKEVKRILGIRKPLREESIQSIFVYLNYNTIRYFNYYTRYWVEQVKTLESVPAKIEKFSFALKNINQIQIKPGVAYNPIYPSLKEQLVDWITEEISYLERLLALTQKNLLSSGAIPTDFKVQTDLSLSQLAYMLRIFIDSKIIQNKNLSDILRFVSKCYQVKHQNISYESFRVRYYNPEESIRKGVRSILLQLVDYINKT